MFRRTVAVGCTVLLQCLFIVSSVVSRSEALSLPKNNKPVEFDFRGLMVAAFSPTNDDQSLNLDLVPEYAEMIIDNGFKGVLVGGTTGEGPSFSVEERKSLHEAWVNAGQRVGLHVMVQVGGAPYPDVIALTKHAESIGVDSILTLPELYNKPTTAEQLVSYLKRVAEAAPNTPILYYHNPAHSGVTVNMASLASAAQVIPNFKGLKFTSNDLKEAAEARRALKDGQELFLGAEALVAPAGILGIISHIASGPTLFPELFKAIIQAVEDSDVPKAMELQEKLSLALEAIGAGKPASKAALQMLSGLKVGPPRLPSEPLSADARNRIAKNLTSLGFHVKNVKNHHRHS